MKLSSIDAGDEFLGGVKKITAENWRLPDISHAFNMPSEEWLDLILTPRLSQNVPAEIERGFEIVRGTMSYGWYFNPLIPLALDQIYRLLETSLRLKLTRLGISPDFTGSTGRPRKRKIEELTAELIQRRIISKAEEDRILGIRNLRNGVCSPKNSTINPPDEVCQWLQTASDLINSIFK
jgi:hypothetical protein